MTDLVVDGDPTFAELAASRPAPPLTVAACEQRAVLPPRTGGLRGDAVLVTGASGFLGRALVAALRARRKRVVAFVRAIDPALPCEQVEGDITQPIDDALRDHVGTVIHGAAKIQLGADWDAHAATNVGGTAEVARFCGTSPWHHVSTLSVFVTTDRRRGRHAETASPAPDALVHGGYAQTKVAAEAIARASGASIYRLGLLTGSPCDQRARTLAAIARLGAVPAGFLDERFDETPVAYAAAAIAALIDQPPRTFHIAAARGTRLRDAIGPDIVELPYEVWRERADRDATELALAIAAFSRRPDLDLFLATDADFAVEETAALLASLGVVR